MTQATDSTVLQLQRTYPASRERVFDAWTNPEVMRIWYTAGPTWSTPVAESDLRVGGAYRVSMQDPDSGEIHSAGGKYTEVDRPSKVAFTWAWETPSASTEVGTASLVTLEFREADGATTVVLTHSGLADAKDRDSHGHGWNGCLDNLGTRVFTS